jgi:hypothetical protein
MRSFMSAGPSMSTCAGRTRSITCATRCAHAGEWCRMPTTWSMVATSKRGWGPGRSAPQRSGARGGRVWGGAPGKQSGAGCRRRGAWWLRASGAGAPGAAPRSEAVRGAAGSGAEPQANRAVPDADDVEHGGYEQAGLASARQEVARLVQLLPVLALALADALLEVAADLLEVLLRCPSPPCPRGTRPRRPASPRRRAGTSRARRPRAPPSRPRPSTSRSRAARWRCRRPPRPCAARGTW